MKGKVAIVGAGILANEEMKKAASNISHKQANSVIKKFKEDILHSLIEKIDQSSKELKYIQDNQPYLINAAPEMLYPEKKFICKGKHQYREVKEKQEGGLIYVKWQCQCGKTI